MWLCVFRVGFSAEAIAKFVSEKTAVQVVMQLILITLLLFNSFTSCCDASDLLCHWYMSVMKFRFD